MTPHVLLGRRWRRTPGTRSKRGMAWFLTGALHALRTLLGRPVDLVEPASVSKQWLKEEIERGRELVYEA